VGKKRVKSIACASVLALSLAIPAAATGQLAAPAAATQAVNLPTASAVATVYQRFGIDTLWFRNGVPSAATIQLAQILRRAPLDGLDAGPQLALQVEEAVRKAASGSKDDIAAAERTLSAAWVLYVQTIKRPTPGMIYAYEVLKPQGARPEHILLNAKAAPSLEQHVASVASVNPIYAAIRDAEWARMQATGSTTPDPRVPLNLERLRSIPAKGRFVLVDAGSQRLFMYEDGVPVDSMKVIVGSDKLPTPMIASVMYYITFNPYWNAPDHLVREQIARKTLAGGAKYFNSMGYQVMADWTSNSATIPYETIDWKAVAAGRTRLRVRQDPGPKNFMGVLKFPFPNPEDIYLHDTPAKERFRDANLAQSNGCVRLEDAARFGRWLLGREPVPPGSEPEIQVQVPRPVPIYVTYITAQPGPQGLTFTRDYYGWDRPGAAQYAAAQMAASRTPRN
jgi:L,D-transpeptidase YcbB